MQRESVHGLGNGGGLTVKCVWLLGLQRDASIDVEWQVEALAKHTAAALNNTRHAITLLSEETTQMRQVVL